MSDKEKERLEFLAGEGGLRRSDGYPIVCPMRITGGIYARRRIRAPGGEVRPTQDKVRAALFSILAARISGTRFLDLFAGSGAVGLEAVSRGASGVCWVEKARPVFSVLKQNVADICGPSADMGKGCEFQCVLNDAKAFLRRGFTGAPFDMIFADPPYRKGDLPGLMDAIRDGAWLTPGGVMIIEQGAGEAEAVAGGWRMVDERTYGGTRLRMFQREMKP